MKRLAETMASSVRETSSEMVEWAKQASKQQQEATRQIIQARSLDEVLDTSSIPSFYTSVYLESASTGGIHVRLPPSFPKNCWYFRVVIT